MSRNGSGTYTLPESAFIPATPISSAAVNNDFGDIADALTDSLSRTGQGGMQAGLSLNIDGFFYGSDTDTGMRRSGPNEQVITCGGADVVTFTNSGADVAGTLDVNSITIAGNPLIPVGFGPSQWSGTAAPAGWVLVGATYLRATYPALWTFAQAEIALGNTFYTNGDGSTTFTIATMDGYVPAGVDAAGVRIAGFTDVGDTAGSPTHTLTLAQIPTGINSNASNSISVTFPGGNVPFNPGGAASSANIGGGAGNTVPIASGGSGWINAGAATNLAQAISVSSNNTSGTSHPILQPSRAFKYIVYAGA